MFEASKYSVLEQDTPADMAGLDSEVGLVEVVEDPNSTFENNIYCEEYNDEKQERTSFNDLPHTTDNKPSLYTNFGAYGIHR